MPPRSSKAHYDLDDFDDGYGDDYDDNYDEYDSKPYGGAVSHVCGQMNLAKAAGCKYPQHELSHSPPVHL
jgi:hypothetical protein